MSLESILPYIQRKLMMTLMALFMLTIWQSKMDTGMLHTTNTMGRALRTSAILDGSLIALMKNGWQHNWIFNTMVKSISQLLEVEMLEVMKSRNSVNGTFSKSIQVIAKWFVWHVILTNLPIAVNGHQLEPIQIILISLHLALAQIIPRKGFI